MPVCRAQLSSLDLRGPGKAHLWRGRASSGLHLTGQVNLNMCPVVLSALPFSGPSPRLPAALGPMGLRESGSCPCLVVVVVVAVVIVWRGSGGWEAWAVNSWIKHVLSCYTSGSRDPLQADCESESVSHSVMSNSSPPHRL